MQRATASGVRLMFTPSASSTSALPRLARHRAPAVLGHAAPRPPRPRSAAAVEILKVWAASPPVPQVSTSSARVGHRHPGRELAHHLGGGRDLADGLLLHPQPHEDAGDLRRGHLAAHDLPHQRQHLVVEDFALLDEAVQGFLRLSCAFTSWREKLASSCVPVLGQDGFRVELHALDRQRLVAHAHDLAVVGPGGDFEAIRQGFALDHQRVIARGVNGLGRPANTPPSLWWIGEVLPCMSCLACTILPAERLADALVAEAHAEDRDLAGEVAGSAAPKCRPRSACTGPGEITMRSGLSCVDLVQR